MEEKVQLFASEEIVMYVGTYSYKNSAGGGGVLTVREITSGMLAFQLSISRGAPSYNSGYLSGEIVLKDGVAAYSDTEYESCVLTFEFEEEKIVIIQTEEQLNCGFGHAVYAVGEYFKKSSEPRDISPW